MWFQDTEHGPGTNLEALLVDGESTLLQIQELPSGKFNSRFFSDASKISTSFM